MFNLTVRLTTVSDVQKFVQTCTRFDTIDIDIVSGRYVIDAKSIMGIFSLNLSKPLTLNVHIEKENAAALIDALQPFLA